MDTCDDQKNYHHLEVGRHHGYEDHPLDHHTIALDVVLDHDRSHGQDQDHDLDQDLGPDHDRDQDPGLDQLYVQGRDPGQDLDQEQDLLQNLE